MTGFVEFLMISNGLGRRYPRQAWCKPRDSHLLVTIRVDMPITYFGNKAYLIKVSCCDRCTAFIDQGSRCWLVQGFVQASARAMGWELDCGIFVRWCCNTFCVCLVGGVLLGVTHPAKKPDRKSYIEINRLSAETLL